METQLNIDIQKPPYNEEVEQSILGMIFVDSKKMRDIIDKVKVDMFFLKEHKWIFTAMIYLYKNNSDVSYLTVFERLKYKNNYEDIDYLIALANAIASSVNFDNYINILMDLYQKRKLYDWSYKRLTKPMSGISGANLVKDVQGVIENMGIVSNIEYEKFEDYIDDWVNEVENPTQHKQYLFPYEGLNDLIKLKPSNFVLIASRPSCGKSAFATNIVKGFCEQGLSPLFISLEMSKKEYMDRLMSIVAGVEVWKFDETNKDKLTSDDWTKIMSAKEKISKWNFNFFDKGSMYVEHLQNFAKLLKRKGELDVIVIDYLQLMSTYKYKGQKVNEVGEISRILKQIAMELEIPVIALSQLNRGVVANGEVREPQLNDLRSSGDLEQDANAVIMLHTPDVEQKFGNQKGKNARWIDLFVRKNRSGKLGHLKFDFVGDYMSFKEKGFNPQIGGRDGWFYKDEVDFTNKKDEILEDLPF